MAGIEITRVDLSAAELRSASGRAPDARSARRMLALALVLEGVDRQTAAETCGMDRQTLRDWVHRYNADGLAGLTNRFYAGPPRRLSEGDLAAFAEIVDRGPDPETDGVTRWRRVDLKRVIEQRFGVVMHAHGRQAIEGAWLRQADGARAASRERSAGPGGVQKNFADEVAAVLPEAARGKPIEIWFQDEARVGQQGTLTRVWARRGTRPRAPRDRRYKWAYIFGAVCPARAVAAALVLPRANADMLSLHLAEIATQVASSAHAVLVLDGAGWHVAHDLVVPANISLLVLPPYAPELNPVENVWQYLRQNKLANTVFQDAADIVDRCSKAWRFFADDKLVVASITSRSWAKVSG